MKKTRNLSVIATLIVLLLSFNAYADVAVSPLETPGGLLLIAAIIIGVLVLIAWLIIRSIRKKKNEDIK
jgi:hypothetical protein